MELHRWTPLVVQCRDSTSSSRPTPLRAGRGWIGMSRLSGKILFDVYELWVIMFLTLREIVSRILVNVPLFDNHPIRLSVFLVRGNKCGHRLDGVGHMIPGVSMAVFGVRGGGYGGSPVTGNLVKYLEMILYKHAVIVHSPRRDMFLHNEYYNTDSNRDATTLRDLICEPLYSARR